jgi:hypothetical protein
MRRIGVGRGGGGPSSSPQTTFKRNRNWKREIYTIIIQKKIIFNRSVLLS